jgi:site-specific DNA-methyltransferase (adenine-specific)
VLGDHRLICGDSLSSDTLTKLLGPDKAYLWLTDPPYNVSYSGGTKEALTIENDSMGDTEFLQFLTKAFSTASDKLRAGGCFYIWHADSESYNSRGALRQVGLKVRQCLIWVKSSLVIGRQDYQWKHEPCLYGWKDGASHYWASDRKQTTVLEFDKPTRNGKHPTMKPVALFEYQLLNSSARGDIVLDTFGGSGTTLICAEKNERRARIVELDPRYCDVICKRYIDFTGNKVIKESDGTAFPM